MRWRARVLAWPQALLLAVTVLVPSAGLAQGRITNAKTETRSAAQGLVREVQNVAARGVASWIGYRAPGVAGPRQMCCYDSISSAGNCCGQCRLGIYRNDARACVRRAHVGDLRHARQHQVVDEAALAAQQARILETRNGLADAVSGILRFEFLAHIALHSKVPWLTKLSISPERPS